MKSDVGATVQLIYVSRALMGAASAIQMSGILAEARPANARDGITGALTAVDGQFVQVLEGALTPIEALIGRLRRDPRHTGLVVVERRLVAQRAFGDWDMVSPRLVPDELVQLKAVLGSGVPRLDAVIPVLAKAIANQEAVLEGRRARPASTTSPTAQRTMSRDLDG